MFEVFTLPYYFLFELVIFIAKSNIGLLFGLGISFFCLFKIPTIIQKKEKSKEPYGYYLLDVSPVVSVAMIFLLLFGKFNPDFLLNKENLSVIIWSAFVLTGLTMIISVYLLPKIIKKDH